MHWIDPHCLPETHGTVTQFLLNPHGELDGLVLDKNKQVHFPPHLAEQVALHIARGNSVRVRRVKPRTANMIAAVALTVRNDVVILDKGPGPKVPSHDKPHAEKVSMQTDGEVRLSLYGPKGELRGALLADGTSLRMAPHAADEAAACLAPGARVRARGQA